MSARAAFVLVGCAAALIAPAGCGGDDDAPETATEAAASPFEEGLREKLEDVDFTCEGEIPPADGEQVVCDATGESDDGEPASGELTLEREGEQVTYSLSMATEDGGIVAGGGFLSVDGGAVALDLTTTQDGQQE